ncbi:MAG: cyclic pyranopterin monophosphate synthase MoaC [Solirubrobacterales bacterium]
MDELTHLDTDGSARMVDVGAKPATERRAVARSTVHMAPATAEAVRHGNGPKGDVVAVARIAGIQAAKRTHELVPLCHPLALSHIDVDLAIGPDTVTVEATAATTGPTGVEMEAMTAASVAALTVYDMVKGLERGVTIGEVALVSKQGGRSGTWHREAP